ncbi:hypothetical protein [Actinomadura sp. 21ATH]|uniref:hypothetical protein n=1 Tax=Actinomadura sp. 21ATH TaxID=1735444 RepID=UPI0035C18633
MSRRWVAPGGWDIELIDLDGVALLRVRYLRYLRGYCRTVHEVAALLEPAGLTMADLVEMLPTARRVHGRRRWSA